MGAVLAFANPFVARIPWLGSINLFCFVLTTWCDLDMYYCQAAAAGHGLVVGPWMLDSSDTKSRLRWLGSRINTSIYVKRHASPVGIRFRLSMGKWKVLEASDDASVMPFVSPVVSSLWTASCVKIMAFFVFVVEPCRWKRTAVMIIQCEWLRSYHTLETSTLTSPRTERSSHLSFELVMIDWVVADWMTRIKLSIIDMQCIELSDKMRWHHMIIQSSPLEKVCRLLMCINAESRTWRGMRKTVD